MFSNILQYLTVPLFAQDSGMANMMIWVFPAILIIMWFLVIRPQQKEQEKRRKMVDSLEKHMKVYTVGGLVGIIYSIDKERGRIVLKVDDSNNMKIEFLLDAIVAPIVGEIKSDDKK
ncbi:MAG: preprotein translocase subunit YajC [Planctomycetaceae bacterium]|jgi:preprotein translocase subunit YajC|nr:preprotein translocase subunit YajC [Planctomycetaceae bacterium]